MLFIALVFWIILGISAESLFCNHLHHTIFRLLKQSRFYFDLWNYNQDSGRRKIQFALARRLEQSYSLVASIFPVPPRARPKRKATPL